MAAAFASCGFAGPGILTTSHARASRACDVVASTASVEKYGKRSVLRMKAPQATQDKVVLKKLAAQTQSASGLVLSENAQNMEKFGEVVSIGAGRYVADGTYLKFGVEVGDVVLFDSYTVEQVKVDNEFYTIIPIADIRAKLA